MKNIKKKIQIIIKKITKKKINLDENTVLTNDILDSFNMLSLIDALEKEFKVNFTEKDLHYTNFKNIKKIALVIKRNVK